MFGLFTFYWRCSLRSSGTLWYLVAFPFYLASIKLENVCCVKNRFWWVFYVPRTLRALATGPKNGCPATCCGTTYWKLIESRSARCTDRWLNLFGPWNQYIWPGSGSSQKETTWLHINMFWRLWSQVDASAVLGIASSLSIIFTFSFDSG